MLLKYWAIPPFYGKCRQTHIYIQTHINTCIHPYKYTYVQTYMYQPYTHIYLSTYIHTCIHTYIHTNTVHMQNLIPVASSKRVNEYVHTYIHTCIHAYMHTYIHTYTHTYAHAYIHTYTLYMQTLIPVACWRDIHESEMPAAAECSNCSA